MVDADLAELYGVVTRRLNEQVRRNNDRFPADFAFVLTEEEFANLKSQNATSSSNWGLQGRLTLCESSIRNTTRSLTRYSQPSVNWPDHRGCTPDGGSDSFHPNEFIRSQGLPRFPPNSRVPACREAGDSKRDPPLTSTSTCSLIYG